MYMTTFLGWVFDTRALKIAQIPFFDFQKPTRRHDPFLPIVTHNTAPYKTMPILPAPVLLPLRVAVHVMTDHGILLKYRPKLSCALPNDELKPVLRTCTKGTSHEPRLLHR